jgi:hypothetical protein
MVERERAIRIGHAWQRSARALSRALRTVTRVHGSAIMRLLLHPLPDDTHDTADPPRTLPSNRVPPAEMACTGTEGAE